MSHRLRGSKRPLTELHDVALLDLDGVVYVGDRPVPGAPEALETARSAGMRLAFVTNNASRTASAVADRLRGMGVAATADEVTTSAQAAARHLAELLPPGSAVLVVGGEGLRGAVTDRGLRPVSTAVDPDSGEPVAAVVQGFAPEVGWTLLAEAAVAIRAGARWVATNLDRTIPSERGPLPGNGALVHVLQFAFGFTPESTGKPDPTMHLESVDRSAAANPLVVGDRLDTDVEGAVRAGAPSLLVLSGVTDAVGVLGAGPGERPDHLARDVGGLLTTHPEVDWSDPATSALEVGRWRATLADGQVRLARSGAGQAGSGDDALDALRLVAPAVWRTVDTAPEAGGAGAPGVDAVVVADDAEAERVLAAWGLAAGGPGGVRTTRGA
ncbi:HAD-IIA family hydrolase [Jatrophihabitans sp. YIM 134969]